MKSLVCLAELAVVILCYVYNGVASEQRGKYEKKRGTRATQDTCDDSQSKYIAEINPVENCVARVVKGSVICLDHRNETSALKQLWNITIK